MKNVLLVKYGEILLRGKNRKLIENQLSANIEKNLKNLGEFHIYKDQGRFIVERKDDKDLDFDKVIPLVVNIFGITAVCPAIKTDYDDFENIKKLAFIHMKEHYSQSNYTFKVETKRADKSYSMDSREICTELGGHILNNMENLKVDVKNPEIVLTVEIRSSIYITSQNIKGFGGLPVGNSGKATLLLSGGIDSPVAGFMMAKRGVEIEAVYFHSPPYTSDRAKQKVIDLAKQITIYTGKFKLYIVPFTDVQLKIYNSVQAEKMTLILKRAMLKISEKIAIKNGSMGLITGDSIGQVASQTMHSIHSVSSAINSMEIFRPLCALDKQEIIDIARKIGTFEISIRPFEDCCTIFVAKHPETKPRKHIIESVESKIDDLDQMIEDAVKQAEIIEF